jgi:hypothetical protein
MKQSLWLLLVGGFLILGCGDEPGDGTGTGGSAAMSGSGGSGAAAGAGGAAPMAGSGGAFTGGTAGSANAGRGGGNASGGDSGRSGAGRGGSGASGNGGMANAGRSGSAGLTPEEIRDETQAQCVPFCDLVSSTCSEIPEEDCLTGCRVQAQILYDAGHCAAEFLDGYRCFNAEITAAEIDCSGPTIRGCATEQSDYQSCWNEGP